MAKSKRIKSEKNQKKVQEDSLKGMKEEPLNDEIISQEQDQNNDQQVDDIVDFIQMGLDDRVLLAIQDLEWFEPTPIQEVAIPLILEGRDVLAKARTGSGKTGAYAIPLINKILSMKKQFTSKQCTSALVLTPTRELCAQATRNILELSRYCQQDLICIDIAHDVPVQTQRQLLSARQDIIVSTPAKILTHLKAANVSLKETLELLVIDEADLLLSFGYESEMKELVSFLPKSVQTILLSATLNDDVLAVKNLFLHNPAVLKLKETELPSSIQLDQYQISCKDEEDKFVLLYSMLKLNLIKGKSLVFVNSVNKSYKLKLFLEQFGIRSCVLNSELPINSRMHVIEQFNGGLYENIIASDEKMVVTHKQQQESDDTTTRKRVSKQDKEYNISRGIDFKNVANVINFEFPLDTKSYVHRVGRTARGSLHGSALSFVDTSEEDRLRDVESELLSKSTDKNQQEIGLFKTFKFKMDEIEGFRYRARDVLRAITSVMIKEARLKEIKNELLNSAKLKSYFEENPREAQMLRHDKELHVNKLHEHLKHVPDYIIPPSLKGISLRPDSNTKAARQKMRNVKRQMNGLSKFKKRQSDPLRSFNFKGIKKRYLKK